MNPPEAAIVLIIRETNIPAFPVGFRHEILAVTNRGYNTITLPGGKVDPGETALDAVVRETKEEVNLVISPQDLLLIGKSLSLNARVTTDQRLVSFYYAKRAFGKPSNVETGTDLFWCSFEELIERSFFAPFYQRHLPDGISHLPPTRFAG